MDFVYILKVTVIEFVYRLGLGWERKRRIKNDFKVFKIDLRYMEIGKIIGVVGLGGVWGVRIFIEMIINI